MSEMDLFATLSEKEIKRIRRRALFELRIEKVVNKIIKKIRSKINVDTSKK